jgi:hypothetical protein
MLARTAPVPQNALPSVMRSASTKVRTIENGIFFGFGGAAAFVDAAAEAPEREEGEDGERVEAEDSGGSAGGSVEGRLMAWGGRGSDHTPAHIRDQRLRAEQVDRQGPTRRTLRDPWE